MANYGNLYGPNFTFLGIPACDLEIEKTYADADVVIVGAPVDGGTSHRSGTKFGPMAIRAGDYLPHDGSRPHLALRVDALQQLKVVDAGDLAMPSSHLEESLNLLEVESEKIAKSGAIPLVLGGDHSIASADIAGVAKALGWGKIGVIHFDAHADTGENQMGQLYGHGTPMRRLIERGAVRGDRFLQIGLRGYWPEDETLKWMAEQGMRSYEMTEINARGLNLILDEALKTVMQDCVGVFLSVDIDVVDPGMAPGTGTPEPGGLTSRELLEAVRRIALEVPVVGMDIVEVSPPYDCADITAILANRVALEVLSAIAHKKNNEKNKSSEPYNPKRNLLDR